MARLMTQEYASTHAGIATMCVDRILEQRNSRSATDGDAQFHFSKGLEKAYGEVLRLLIGFDPDCITDQKLRSMRVAQIERMIESARA